jgi:hypothetical protein
MTGLEAVEHQLQAPAPAGLRNLAEAGDKAFALVPRILRGPIRRMFG